LYKQTVLGVSWAIIQPLFSAGLFSIIFGGLADVPSDGVPYPAFSLAALLPWTYFSSAVSSSTSSLVSNADMLQKVYFPRAIIPMAPVFSKLVNFVVGLSVLVGVMIWYGIVPSLYALITPLLVVLMMLTATGIGMWLSALSVQYRDVNHAMSFLVRLMMYAAPVVWPASLLAEKAGYTAYVLYGLYPMVGVIEGFRASLLQTTAMPWVLIGMGTLSTAAIFISGAFYFHSVQHHFADVA
jgi:lipopolysaccharide transport system permease protein